MHALAASTALINWNALWKIVLAAAVGGIGVVVTFGVLLLCLSRARSSTNSAKRLAYFAASTLCGLVCLAVVAFGVYAMVEKPVSKPAKAKAANVMGAATASTVRLTAAR
jgi:NADH:ubiquinone oxidoreductase subunit 6 (subunit J)